jgi:hypothetical protein
VTGAGVEQVLRAEQAADVVGAERRAGAIGHVLELGPERQVAQPSPPTRAAAE